MKVGYVWTTTRRSGTKFEKVEIPADLRDQAEEYREKMIEGLAEVDEQPDGEVPRRRGDRRPTS